jgi:hypothetical protein
MEIQKEKRPGEYSEVYCDASKIKELKWKAKFTNLEDSLPLAWNWHRTHPNGYATTDEIANGKYNLTEEFNMQDSIYLFLLGTPNFKLLERT